MAADDIQSAIERACSRPYPLIAFDWDGTAVPHRKDPAQDVVSRVEKLAELGVINAIITGTNINNLSGIFFDLVRPDLRHTLLACMNRCSEVFSFDEAGNRIVLYARKSQPWEDEAMDAIAITVRDELKAKYGLESEIIFNRLNRRKIDIIPLPPWSEPPTERIGELLKDVNERLDACGIVGGIKAIMDRVDELAEQHGIDIRLTTDVKHVELGLTDKSDSVAYLVDQVARPRGIPNEDIVFLGDEFGPIDGFAGSDYKTTGVEGAAYLSVGKEPNGVPDGVLHLGGGVPRFLEFLDRQIQLHGGDPRR